MSTLYSCVKDGNPRPVVSALVVRSGRVLMIQCGAGSYEGYWALPGGVINKGEEPEKAVLRRLLEESGVDGASPQLLTTYLTKNATGLSYATIDTVYKVKMYKPLPVFRKTKEILDISFFSLSQLPEKIFVEHRNIISKFAQQE